MANIIATTFQFLRQLLKENIDPRVQHFPLVGSPVPVFFIIGAYLAFVLHFGPKWMAKRKPFDLKYVMRVYNALQVVSNVTLIAWGLPNSYLRKEFSLTCQPVDHTNTQPWMIQLLYVTYGYYITKYLDLLDTVFFILRKKRHQVTFLHVYHHGGMVFCLYIYTKFLAGSHATMLGAINLCVHIVMYSYYFATSMSDLKGTIWWKRHITQLQLMQFGYLIFHFLMPIVNNHCKLPVVVSIVGLTQNLFMFMLFFDFYYKAYIRKHKQDTAKIFEGGSSAAAAWTTLVTARKPLDGCSTEDIKSM